MDDLVAFLRAQLDERLTRIERFAVERWKFDDGVLLGIDSFDYIICTGDDDLGAYFVDCSPDIMLAEVEAKRRIIDEFEAALSFYEQPANRNHPAGEVNGLLGAVKLLALPYADQPGYCEEWRP